MKKIVIIVLLLYSGTMYSQDNSKAVVCLSDTEKCLEVTRVKAYGEWKDACCQLLPNYYESCNDNCTDKKDKALLTHPLPPAEFERKMAHMVLGKDHDVWIIKNNKLSQQPYDNSSPEYIYLNERFTAFAIADYYPNTDYITVTISDKVYAIIAKGESHQRGDAQMAKFFEESLKYLKEAYSLELFPNPATRGQRIKFETPRKVIKIELVGLNSNATERVDFNEIKELNYEFVLPDKFERGTYLVRVYLIDEGVIMKSKLIVK